jgi:putative FmdB family regulatory protein
MPTYEYVCKDCGHELEAFQSIKADPLSDCPECEQPALKRKIGAGSALIFKGSGFYCTDYKEKPKAKVDTDKKVARAKEAAKAVKESSGGSSSGGGDSGGGGGGGGSDTSAA